MFFLLSFFFLAGLRDLAACRLLGGGVLLPEQRLLRSLDSVPLCLRLCAIFSRPQMMDLVPLSPLQDSPRLFAHQGTLTAHILSILLLPPLSLFVVKFNVHIQQRRLSPAIRPSEV